MTYTSRELAELSGYSLSRISGLLKAMGYSPVDIIDKNQNVWDESALEGLLKKKNEVKMEKATNIGYFAAIFNVSNQTIREILTAMNIEPLYVDPAKKLEFYDKSVNKILKEYFNTDKDESEDEHPLVTDKRCLRLSWFPDVLPKCFEDLDEDIA